MNFKKVIIIVLIFVVILTIIVSAYLLFVSLTGNNNNINQNINVNTQPSPTPTPEVSLPDTDTPEDQPAPIPEPEVEPSAKERITYISRYFTERYASYSNQGDFNNFAYIRKYLSPSMDNYVMNQYLPQVQAELESRSGYFGIETRALSFRFTAFDEQSGTAELIVITQQVKYIDNFNNPLVSVKDLKLNFIKTEDDWQITSAVWQEDQ